jgi:hypothetical protein
MKAIDWFYDKIKSHFTHDGDLFETFNFTYAIAKQKERDNLKTLRKKFFKECVENGKVSYAPHDLFEWFKKNID